MAFLQLENITKRFPGCIAVNNLNLEVEQGEVLVLLGPSGCGKTTTLRIIAGLEIQSEGRVILEGKDISDTPPERRNMAMVFQNLALYPHMNIFNNIAFYLQNIGTPKDVIQQKVMAAARTVRIEKLLDRMPHQLSGGERQRVALARALVRNPKVFLLDEPLSSLDAQLRAGMRSELKLLHKTLNERGNGQKGTFIYVTHDQVEALTLGTRIAVMNEGTIVQLATPQELYQKPRNLFTATFVGSPAINLIEGMLEKTEETAIFHFEDRSVPVGSTGLIALQCAGCERQPAILGVRPESIRLVPEGAPGSLGAEVITIEPLGQVNLLTLLTGELRLTCLVNPEERVREGQNVYICFQVESIHFFDPQTGQNLIGEAK